MYRLVEVGVVSLKISFLFLIMLKKRVSNFNLYF